MVHVSASCNPNFHATGAHYINADTTAFMQFIEGDLFKDFPTLRFIIPHGGGAVPYHWGRYRGLADMLKRPPLRRARDEERLLRHLRLSPAGHRPAGPGDRHRQHPVRLGDGRRGARHRSARPAITSTTPSATSTRCHSRRRQASDLRAERAAGLSAPRRPAARRGDCERRRASGPGCALRQRTRPPAPSRWTQDWLPFHPTPRRPRFVPPPGAVDAHCHVFGPGAQLSLRARSASYTPCDAPKTKLCGAAGLPRVRPQRHRAGHLPRRRQPRPGRCAAEPPQGRARGVATVAAERHRRASSRRSHAAGRARRALQLRASAWSMSPHARCCCSIARRVAPLGWHVVIYFEAAELPELYDFFASLPTTVVVDHMGRPDVTRPSTAPSSSSSSG